MSQVKNDELWNEIASLEKEKEDLSQKKKECEQLIIDYRNKEDPAKNIFYAKEIFELQQEKLKLGVEIDLRQKKKNRILFSLEDPFFKP